MTIDWFDFATKFGLPLTQLVFFVFGLHKGWVVMGRTHDNIVELLEDAASKQEKRADKWESRAEALLERAASAALASERAVAKVIGDEDDPGTSRRRGSSGR